MESSAIWASHGQDARSLENGEGDGFGRMSWKEEKDREVVIEEVSSSS